MRRTPHAANFSDELMILHSADRCLLVGAYVPTCFACHRVGGEGGGVGPDLTAAMRRFSVQDFLEAVIEPIKVISDQYGFSIIRKREGSDLHGRVVNYYGDSIGLQTDSLNAAKIDRIPRSEILVVEDSPISPMPPGLLNVLSWDDILDMMAFLKAQTGS